VVRAAVGVVFWSSWFGPPGVVGGRTMGMVVSREREMRWSSGSSRDRAVRAEQGTCRPACGIDEEE